MRNLFFSLAFPFLCSISVANAAQAIHDSNLLVFHDVSKERGEAHIYAWTVPIDDQAIHQPYLTFSVKKSRELGPLTPTITMSMKATKGLRPECTEPQWFLDGQPIKVERYARTTSQLPEKGVLERLSSVFTLHALRQFTKGREVVYQLCDNQYTMTSAEAEGLKRVLGLYDGKLFIPDHPPHD